MPASPSYPLPALTINVPVPRLQLAHSPYKSDGTGRDTYAFNNRSNATGMLPTPADTPPAR